MLAVIVVNEQAELRLPDVCAIETGDGEPHVFGHPRLSRIVIEIFFLARAADADGLLVRGFVARAGAKLPAYLTALRSAVDGLVLAPRHKFRADKIAIAIVDDRGGY